MNDRTAFAVAAVSVGAAVRVEETFDATSQRVASSAPALGARGAGGVWPFIGLGRVFASEQERSNHQCPLKATPPRLTRLGHFCASVPLPDFYGAVQEFQLSRVRAAENGREPYTFDDDSITRRAFLPARFVRAPWTVPPLPILLAADGGEFTRVHRVLRVAEYIGWREVPERALGVSATVA
jgi:hypothetical protein